MEITGWRRTGTLMITLTMGLAAGCREAGETADEEATPATAQLEVDTAQSLAVEPEPPPALPNDGAVRTELEARAGTDVIGTVVLIPRDGATAVTVEIHGANSGYPYVAELIEGSCGGPGVVVAELAQLTAGEGGDARVERRLDRALLTPAGSGRAVWIRGEDDPTAVVACGDLGATTDATSATGR